MLEQCNIEVGTDGFFGPCMVRQIEGLLCRVRPIRDTSTAFRPFRSDSIGRRPLTSDRVWASFALVNQVFCGFSFVLSCLTKTVIFPSTHLSAVSRILAATLLKICKLLAMMFICSFFPLFSRCLLD